jgi:hypothetical protein
MHTTQQDPQDKAFGSAAAEDQEFVDQLDDEGVTAEDLPDPVTEPPRAAGKAEPAS